MLLTPSEMRLIHELMFFFPTSALNVERTKLIEGPENYKKNEFRWGDFLRREASAVYTSLAQKLDQNMMVSPTVMAGERKTPVVP